MFLPVVVCGRTHVLFTLSVFLCVCWCLAHIVLCFCYLFLRLVYPMLPLSLGLSSFWLSFRYSLLLIPSYWSRFFFKIRCRKNHLCNFSKSLFYNNVLRVPQRIFNTYIWYISCQCNLLGNSHYISIDEYTFKNIIQVLIETGSTSGSQVYWQIGCKGNYDDWRMTTYYELKSYYSNWRVKLVAL